MNILRAVGLGRLTQAANWLLKHETAIEGRFKLSIWRGVASDNQEERSIMVEHDELQNDCGTTACAVGWLTTDPEFQKQGLKMGLNPLYDFKHLIPAHAQPTQIVMTLGHWEKEGFPTEAQGSLVHRVWAVQEFFQITDAEFMELFMDCSYPTSPTVSMVAKRIKQFVERESVK